MIILTINIKTGGTAVEVVDDFYYLGSFVPSNSSCDKDCQVRIGKANSVFGRLKLVWFEMKKSGRRHHCRNWNLSPRKED